MFNRLRTFNLGEVYYIYSPPAWLGPDQKWLTCYKLIRATSLLHSDLFSRSVDAWNGPIAAALRSSLSLPTFKCTLKQIDPTRFLTG